MRVIKDDFKPGQPASAVDSGWFNAVAKFINKLTGSNGIRVNRSGEFPCIMVDNSISAMGQSPVDNRSASEFDTETPVASTLTFTNWAAGGENGVKLRLYALVKNNGVGGHELQPIDLEINSVGFIKSVSQPTGNLGFTIQA